jgi:hypothetical protein
MHASDLLGASVYVPTGTRGVRVVIAERIGGNIPRDEKGRADYSEVEANVRLIAAAPDLLEVLQQVETFTAYASCDNCREMHLIARAAIAKATGEAA